MASVMSEMLTPEQGSSLWTLPTPGYEWRGRAGQANPCGSRKLPDVGVSRQTEEGCLAIPSGFLQVVVPTKPHGSMLVISC